MKIFGETSEADIELLAGYILNEFLEWVTQQADHETLLAALDVVNEGAEYLNGDRLLTEARFREVPCMAEWLSEVAAKNGFDEMAGFLHEVQARF
jgi:hypothetical protein